MNCIYLKDGLGLEPFFHYKIPLSDGTIVKMSSKVTHFSRRLTRRIVKIMKSEYTFFIIYDTRQSFLLKMHDDQMRNGF